MQVVCAGSRLKIAMIYFGVHVNMGWNEDFGELPHLLYRNA